MLDKNGSNNLHRRQRILLRGVFTVIFLISLVGFAPASLFNLVLSNNGLNIRYEKAEGTIWNGMFQGAYVDDIPIGELTYSINPLALMRGAIRAEIETKGGAVEGASIVSLALDGAVRLRQLDTEISLSAIRKYRLLGAPFTGQVRLAASDFQWSRKGCRSKKGAITTNALHAPAKQLGRMPLDLTGEFFCQDNNLFINLAGQNADGELGIDARITPALRYSMNIKVIAPEQDMQDTLKAFGFAEKNGVLVLDSIGAVEGTGT